MSKTAIVYWSATGSCKAVSQALAKILPDRCEVIDITLTQPKSIDCDRLILIMPVHAQDIPRIAAQALRTISIATRSAAVVAVFGGVHPGKAAKSMHSILTDAGIPVTAAVNVSLPHCYLRDLGEEIHFSMQHASELAAALDASAMPCTPRGSRQLFACLPKKLLARFTMTKPSHSKSLCKGCNACIKACPTGAINEKYHVDQSKCIRCLACVYACKSCALHTRLNPLTLPYLRKNRAHPCVESCAFSWLEK